MAMDSVIFQAMAIELNRLLAGSRLDRVIQVSAGTVVLSLWNGRDKVRLLLQAEGQGCFFRTRGEHAAPAAPPRFCQLLRARLRRLVAIDAEPLDRVLHLRFLGPERQAYDLVLEALGSRSNLLLIDSGGKIVDLLIRHDGRQEGARRLLPGEPYILPEQRQPRLPLLGDSAEAVQLLADALDEGQIARLPLAPMSPPLARAIAAARSAGKTPAEIVGQLGKVFAGGAFAALRVAWCDGIGHLPLELGLDAFNRVERYDDLSALQEASLAEEGQESARTLTTRLAALIANQRKRLRKRLENIEAERARHVGPEAWRVRGDLLLANLYRIKRGMAAVTVDDYYQSPAVPVTVELDTKLTPQENAERCFKQYRKGKRAGEHIERRREETEQEIAWLDQVELALDEAEGGDDLYQVQLELENAGLLKATKGKLGRRPPSSPEDRLQRAVTDSGLKVFWGRNSATNDYVSRRLTGPNDLWFHAHNMPGCHLVLKCGELAGEPPEGDVLFAAALAAGYSKGKDAGKVEVIVTRGRNVKKPKGARPGLVTVDSYRTVLVAPRRLND